jgi:hypothetical protein
MDGVAEPVDYRHKRREHHIAGRRVRKIGMRMGGRYQFSGVIARPQFLPLRGVQAPPKGLENQAFLLLVQCLVIDPTLGGGLRDLVRPFR